MFMFLSLIKANIFIAATKERLLESSSDKKGREEGKRSHSPGTNWSVLLYTWQSIFQSKLFKKQ